MLLTQNYQSIKKTFVYVSNKLYNALDIPNVQYDKIPLEQIERRVYVSKSFMWIYTSRQEKILWLWNTNGDTTDGHCVRVNRSNRCVLVSSDIWECPRNLLCCFIYTKPRVSIYKNTLFFLLFSCMYVVFFSHKRCIFSLYTMGSIDDKYCVQQIDKVMVR